MRTLKELLIELKTQYNTDYSYSKCICFLISDLYLDGTITRTENRMLTDFIRSNRPKWYSTHCSWNQLDSSYWWKPYDWTPRLKWIDAQINKLK